jgi:hypothetical protein
MATTDVLHSLGIRLGVNAFKRQFEEATEPVLLQAIRDGMDANATLKRIAMATRDIPGLRIGGHALVSAGGALMAEHADSLWSGRKDSFTNGLRVAMKRLGPQLHFASDIAADALERAVGEKVDRVVSSEMMATADRDADMDYVVIVPDYFGMRPFFPVRVDEHGNPELTTQGAPRVLDREFIRFAERWIRDNPKKKFTTGGGRGQQRKEEEIAPTAPWQFYTFQEWLKLVESSDEIGSDQIDALRREFAPDKKWDELLSLETQAVIRALIRKAIRDALDMCLEGEQSLFTKARLVLESAPDYLAKVKQVLSGSAPWVMKGLYTWLGALALALACLVLGIVVSADGVPVMAMIVAGLAGMSVSAYVRNWWPVGIGAAVVAILGALGFFVPEAMWIVGVMLAVSGGIIGFAFTWPIPMLETSLNVVLKRFMDMDDDWLKGLGRRIAAFALSLGCSVLPVLLYLHFPPIVRVILVAAAVLGPMAYLFIFSEVNEEERAQRMALRAVGISVWINTIPVVVLGILLGVYYAYSHELVTGPELVQWIMQKDRATGESGTLATLLTRWEQTWVWLAQARLVQSMALVLALLVLLVLVHRLTNRPIKGVGWILAVLGLLGMFFIWFHEPAKGALAGIDLWNSQVSSADVTVTDGRSTLRVKEQQYEDGTTRTQLKGKISVGGTQSASSPPTNKPSLKELCDANQVDWATCHEEGYK